MTHTEKLATNPAPGPHLKFKNPKIKIFKKYPYQYRSEVLNPKHIPDLDFILCKIY
jgi:hypothetical protein